MALFSNCSWVADIFPKWVDEAYGDSKLDGCNLQRDHTFCDMSGCEARLRHGAAYRGNTFRSATREQFHMLEAPVVAVFIAALVTAIATGLGALPFLIVPKISPRWMSLSHALAAGLMLAACHGLIAEGIALSPARVLIGILLGLVGIVVGHRLVADGGTHEIANLKGLDASKALLIVGVMTVHSFAEGVAVGVSFAGDGALAKFISTAIAVHNIPEGLAIALVLVPRGTPVWQAALWSIFTSLPQPLMAVPSYLFIEAFQPLLPMGFGLAAGAMIWLVFSELVPEANEHESSDNVAIAVTLAFAAMIAFQYLVLK